MKPRLVLGASLALAACVLAIALSPALSKVEQTSSGTVMTGAAQAYLATLSDEQKKIGLLEFDARERVGWHFIPLATRKGVRVRDMNDAQRKAAHQLLATSLSELGYSKATQIMHLEEVLAQLEGDKEHKRRDPLKYYFTLFGEPQAEGRWGLSVEGHHLSFNFVVDRGEVVASTPQFMAANPSFVQKDFEGAAKKGTAVLAKEEELGFALVKSLDEAQFKTALIADKAPADIRGAAEPQAPQTKPEGIAAGKLSAAQKEALEELVEEYIAAMPADVAAVRRSEIEKAGFDNVYFAWAGATKLGIGHYYRVQGPTLLIELVNVQPDAAGNPASHIHCVWRDPRGDFGIPVAK